MNKFCYVPIVKWKQGEQGALSILADEIKDQIIPLIEIVPDFNVDKFESTFNKNWANRHFYFDVFPECYEAYGGSYYFELLEKCNSDFVIPVLALDDDVSVIDEVNSYSSNGIAFRITSYSTDILEEQLTKIVEDFNPSETDLIIDLKAIDQDNIHDKNIVLKALLSDIPEIDSFRNIILAGASFPETLTECEKHELCFTERYEYKLWTDTKKYNKKYNINLIYSDYCVNHPKYMEYIIGMSPSFNIRYTTDDSYMIIKGDTIKKGGLEPKSIIDLCKKIVNSGKFKGKDYSWGDDFIASRSLDSASNGNLSTWRKVGTNHHITLVVNQLSNLP